VFSLPRVSSAIWRSTLCGAALVSAACSATPDATTGRRLVLQTAITAGDETKPFTNAPGWTIELRTLQIATGALYYFEGATIFASAKPTWLDRVLGIGVAHAHPGHYVEGTARGEMRTAGTWDLMKGEVAMAAGAGVSGTTRSATFGFGIPPQGPLAIVLGANVIVVEGVASKGTNSRNFRAEILGDDVKEASGVTSVLGCEFTEVDMQANGLVRVSVHPKRWFEQVEFDDVQPGEAAKPTLLAVDGLARKQLIRGVKQGDAYTFKYEAKP
jgi:hypothetical protein